MDVGLCLLDLGGEVSVQNSSMYLAGSNTYVVYRIGRIGMGGKKERQGQDSNLVLWSGGSSNLIPR